MLRTGIMALALIFALHSPSPAQGLLDSIFGPGGLGLWGNNNFSNQFNSPEPYAAGNQMPGQQPYSGYPQAPGYQQQYSPQQGYAPQGQGYYPQPGGYSGAQGYQQEAAGSAPPVQYSYPQQYQTPQQYGAAQQYSPQQQQAPIQQYAPQQQYMPQQQSAAPPTGGQPTTRTQRAPAASGLRAGQYSPGQLPPGQLPISADDLPPGAVSVSTTTPEGTRVEYYPPAGEPAEPAQRAVRQGARQPRQGAAAGAAPVRRLQPREQTTVDRGSSGVAPIAMPKPVEIPGSQDPRSGWGTAVNRGPGAPLAR